MAGDEFTFSVGVIDNIEVDSVKAEYWYSSAGVHKTIPLKKTASYWEETVTVQRTLDEIHYFFTAEQDRGK